MGRVPAPRSPHGDLGQGVRRRQEMTPKGNQYAIAALKDRRATLAGEIIQFKEGIRYRQDMLAHLDASLRFLDPSYRSEVVPPKSLRREGTRTRRDASRC